MNQRYGIIDLETRSEANLKKVGAYEYANHSSTKILCASWRVGTKAELLEQVTQHKKWENTSALITPSPFAAKVWSPAFDDSDLPGELLRVILDPNIILVAHNALFEQVMIRFVFSKMIPEVILKMEKRTEEIFHIPHDRWACTAAMAASLALPRNLEGACLALKLPIQKDMEGRRLIMKYCRPRKLSKHNQKKWFDSARDLRRIMLYCQRDVDAETLLFCTIPELNPEERKVWLLDQKINFRGFKADRKMVDKALEMIQVETKNLNKETVGISLGQFISTTQRDGVLQWLQSEGVFLPDLRAKTVRDAISEGLVEGDAKRILQIRQSISKTSNKKYSAFEARSRTDGRVRDILVYHAASTGRWAGSGVQPQNFPRGNIGDTTLAADICTTSDLEFIRLIYGNPMDVFSSCLRSVIVAPKGREFFCADYAAIEARVLFWIAQHTSGLKAFFENRPMYEEMAKVIYNVKDINDVTKEQRQVGKRALLGCGYGMGWKKFIQTCKNFSIEVDENVAQTAVNSYRRVHHPVVNAWQMFERAAIEATLRRGTKFKINRTTWWCEKISNGLNFLWCELPSGRRLAYCEPRVKWDLTPWDERRSVLYHWGVDPLTKKWEEAGTYGGRLTENVVQAVSRDLMASSMLRLENQGYDIVLTVHDEVLAERDKDEKAADDFIGLMRRCPPWALGLPVKVEGWKGPRYKK